MTSRKGSDSREALNTGDDHSIAPQPDHPDQNPAVMISINSLLSSDSPRLTGENNEHVRALAGSDATFPPIIVHRSTMRVIDGMHRLRAAVLRGENKIEVQFFDGDEFSAFVLAVEQNVVHGLPLSFADRTSAAARIIRSHPQWSDRAIASTTGLAAKTIGAIRRCSTEDDPQLNSRIGRDGRIRPLSTTEGRRVASQLMTDQPDTPLREIASAAGISLGTAYDVRKRLRRGELSTSSKEDDADRRKTQPKHDKADRRTNKAITRTTARDRALLLDNLKRDPSLRLTDAGGVLIRLLHTLTIETKEWDQLINNVPTHCIPMVSDAARACADAWRELADHLEQR